MTETRCHDVELTPPPFTCPCCGIVSYNPNDLEQGYCGLCHDWTADPVLGPPHLAAGCEARTVMAQRDQA
jgi:hypothetical protein